MKQEQSARYSQESCAGKTMSTAARLQTFQRSRFAPLASCRASCLCARSICAATAHSSSDLCASSRPSAGGAPPQPSMRSSRSYTNALDVVQTQGCRYASTTTPRHYRRTSPSRSSRMSRRATVFWSCRLAIDARATYGLRDAMLAAAGLQQQRGAVTTQSHDSHNRLSPASAFRTRASAR